MFQTTKVDLEEQVNAGYGVKVPKSVHENFIKIINSIDFQNDTISKNNQSDSINYKEKKGKKKGSQIIYKNSKTSKDINSNTNKIFNTVNIQSNNAESEIEDSRIKKFNNEIFNTGRWQPEEHQRFIEAILKYGNEWKSVQKHVMTRSSTQARSHAQKFFVKIKKTNLLDFNIDLNKNSIKSLHEVANQMNSDQYLNTIKTLNILAFEKKSDKESKKKKILLEDNNFDYEYDKKLRNNNIKIMTFKNDNDFQKFSNHDTNKNIIIHNNINNININIHSPYNEKLFNKKRARGNSMDLLFNNDNTNIFGSNVNCYGNQKIDDDFQSFFQTFKCEKYDEEPDGRNLYETFLQFPKNDKNYFDEK